MLKVIRLHRTCRQLRVLGRLARDAYCQTDEFLSIPVYGSHVFAVVRRPETGVLYEIISMNKTLYEHLLMCQCANLNLHICNDSFKSWYSI